MSYLVSIVLVKILPCLAEPGKIIVIGQPDHSLEGVLPYLASLPGVVAYNPETLTVTFRRSRGFITLYPEKVTITQVKDSAEGLELFQALLDAVNATWEKRSELVATTTSRRAPRWLDIWTQLPQTNCKRCGEATCTAFAAALVQNQRSLDECIPLVNDPSFSDRRAVLEAII